MDEFKFGAIDLTEAAVAAPYDRTIEGASTQTVTVRDPGRELLALVSYDDDGQRLVETQPLAIGSDKYALVKIAKSGEDYDWVFEDLAVAAMRQANAKRRARRGDASNGGVNRAQFVRSLVDSVKNPRIPFVAPEVDENQPVLKPTKKELKAQGKSWQAQSVADIDRVFPAHSLSNLGGKYQMTERAVRMVCELVGFHPGRALQMAQIARGESTRYPGIVAGDNGIGLFQITPWAAFPNHDTDLYRTFVKLGGAAGMRNPINNARMAKAMYDSAGFSPWFGTAYLNRSLDWRSVLSVLRPGEKIDLGELDPGETRTITHDTAYWFTVGKPDGPKGENYWEATGRLAEKVGRRRFVVDGQFWWISEEDLFNRPAAVQISESDPEIDSIDFDIDNGKEAKECVVECRADGIKASPGGLVGITDPGPQQGTWLVASISGDRFTDHVTVTLRKPLRERPEPAPELVTEQVTAGEEPTDGGGAGSSRRGPKSDFAGNNFAWPTTVHEGNNFGQDRGDHTHAGIDIPVSYQPVMAAEAGRASHQSQPGGAGTYLVIQHGNAWETWYFHLSKYKVADGAEVRRGQVVAISGNTGHSFGPHLHFEVRHNGSPINPRSVLP